MNNTTFSIVTMHKLLKVENISLRKFTLTHQTYKTQVWTSYLRLYFQVLTCIFAIAFHILQLAFQNCLVKQNVFFSCNLCFVFYWTLHSLCTVYVPNKISYMCGQISPQTRELVNGMKMQTLSSSRQVFENKVVTMTSVDYNVIYNRFTYAFLIKGLSYKSMNR